MRVQHDTSTEAPQCDLRSDTTWQKLSLLLRPLIKHWVYCSHVSSWKGQELDIVEDILQESLFRIFKYAKKAECGEVPPIEMLEHMSIVIAHNCCKDMRRRDQRVVRVVKEDSTGQVLEWVSLPSDTQEKDAWFSTESLPQLVDDPSQRNMTPSAGNQDAAPIQRDPTLAALAARLRNTAPFAAVDPVFRKALKEKLLDKLRLRSSYIAAKEPLWIYNIDEVSGETPFDEVSERAIENISQESLLEKLAQEIGQFPEKQRTALLIDLANRTHFASELTPLQQAFLKKGIRLQDYQLPLPNNPGERNRHASLVSIAYKRVAKIKDFPIDVA